MDRSKDNTNWTDSCEELSCLVTLLRWLQDYGLAVEQLLCMWPHTALGIPEIAPAHSPTPTIRREAEVADSQAKSPLPWRWELGPAKEQLGNTFGVQPVLPESPCDATSHREQKILYSTLFTCDPDGWAWLGVIAPDNFWMPKQKENSWSKSLSLLSSLSLAL